jgi:hypothetical protein
MIRESLFDSMGKEQRVNINWFSAHEISYIANGTYNTWLQ